MGEGLTFLEEAPALGIDELRKYSPLALAYLGDAVFELYIRQTLVLAGNCPVKELHKRATRYVNAGAQAELSARIAPLLKEEEAAVLRRGRNAHSPSVAKHASVSDYRHATGLESLVGWLFLSGQRERLVFLLKEGMKEEL